MIRKLLASTAIATVVATGAYAQMTTSEPAAEPVVEMEQQEVQIQRASGHLASNIIGQRVYNSVADDAENIGSVNDIVLGTNGEADQVIIGVGGFLGLGQRDVAIDYNALEWVERDGQWWLVANMTREQLEAEPEFEKAAYDPSLGLPPESDSAMVVTETDETVGDTAAVGGDDITESEADMTAADQDVVDQDVATAPADGTVSNDDMAAAPATDDAFEDDTAAAPMTDDASEDDVAAAPATDDALEDDTAAAPMTDDASEDDVAAAPATDETLEDDTVVVTETDEAVDQDIAAAPATDEAIEDDTAAAPATDPMETAAIDRSTLQGVEENQLRAEDLMGTTIYGANEENVGSVGDIILSEDGNVDALIIDVGGFLGLGAKEVAVGFENLEFMRDENGNLYLYTQFSKEQLEAQPAFDDTTYADQRDQQRIVVQ